MQTTPAPRFLFNILYLLYLFVPGWVFLQTYLKGQVQLDSHGRLDKIVIIGGGGFVSLVVLVFLYRIGLDRGVLELITSQHLFWPRFHRGEVSLETVGSLSVLQTATVLTVEGLIGGVLGYAFGRAKRRWIIDADRSPRQLIQPWDRVFTESQVGDEVRIITTQDREIRGVIEQLGSPSENFDVLLSDPVELWRTRDGEILKERDLGKTSYHHYQDISRIEFEKDLIPEHQPGPVKLSKGRMRKLPAKLVSALSNLPASIRNRPQQSEEIVEVTAQGDTVNIHLKPKDAEQVEKIERED